MIEKKTRPRAMYKGAGEAQQQRLLRIAVALLEVVLVGNGTAAQVLTVSVELYSFK